MEIRTWLLLWGSPVGIAIFCAGVGVLLWGLSKLMRAELDKAEFDLEQKRGERSQGK